MREVAWALSYSHAQGVVHRDIKPANIMLERGTERAMVMDFGIARLANASGETGVGEVMGTPEYMSPEQACGESVDGRSDLYSLGIVGYFMLSGRLPFTGEPRALLAMQVTQPASPVATVARGAPRNLAIAIDQCLAKDPAQRFATGEALADALAQNLEKKTDIPVPLRVFLDRRRNMIMVIPVAMGLPLVAGIVARLAVASEATATVAALASAAVILAAPISILVYRLRQVMRLGYGPEDIATAVRALQERKREEFLYEFGPTASTRERLMLAVSVGGFALGLGAVIFAALPSSITGGAGGGAAALGVMSGYVAVISSIIRSRWRALRTGTEPRLARFWRGRVGRLLGRIAGHRLERPTLVADRPTELGIAMSAEALYSSLGKDQRKLLGDVPAVLKGLEAHARAMRARITELDASMVEAQRSPARASTTELQDKLLGDLRAARAAAEQRLSDVVTALETLRLDLLRLQAGAGSTESVTQDLSAARALGEDVDRLLEGQREVSRLLTTGQSMNVVS